MEPVTITLNLTNTVDNFKKIALFRGYTTEISKTEAELPDRFDENNVLIPYTIQERVKPNPQTEIEWLTDHIKNVLAKLASELFIVEAKSDAEVIVKAREAEVIALARESIS
jgi:hypothetical protein